MYYHGNFCGPNYSAGKRQGSVRYGRVPAVDQLDWACKFHDDAYSKNRYLKRADQLFWRATKKGGVKAKLAGFAVGLQGLFRKKETSSFKKIQKRIKLMPSRSRSRTRRPHTPRRSRSRTRSHSATTRSQVSLLNNLRHRSPSISRSRHGSPMDTSSTSRSRSLSVVGRHGHRSHIRTEVPQGISGGTVKATGSKSTSAQLNNFQLKGAVRIYETGGQITGVTSDTIYLGHGTAPALTCWAILADAIVKRLFWENGMCPKSMNDLIPFAKFNDQFTFGYKKDYNNSDILETTYSIPAVLATYQNVSDWLLSNAFSLLYDQGQMLYIDFRPFAAVFNVAVPYRRLILSNASVEIFGTSEYRFQNSSTATHISSPDDAGQEYNAENVNAVPLTGKIYSGTGTGSPAYYPATSSNYPTKGQELVINDTLGYFRYTVSAGTATISLNNNPESSPPIPQYFKYVKKCSNVLIEPGQVKTSNLHSHEKMALQSFVKKTFPTVITSAPYPDVNPAYANGIPKVLNKVGKFSAIALEKMLDPLATAIGL